MRKTVTKVLRFWANMTGVNYKTIKTMYLDGFNEINRLDYNKMADAYKVYIRHKHTSHIERTRENGNATSAQA